MVPLSSYLTPNTHFDVTDSLSWVVEHRGRFHSNQLAGVGYGYGASFRVVDRFIRYGMCWAPPWDDGVTTCSMYIIHVVNHQ